MNAFAMMNALLSGAQVPAIEKHPPRDLTLSERGVYSYIVGRANGARVTWPTVDEMATDLRCHRKTILNCTKALGAAGLIKVVRRYKASANYYVIDVPGLHDQPSYYSQRASAVQESALQPAVQEGALLDASAVQESALQTPSAVQNPDFCGARKCTALVHKKESNKEEGETIVSPAPARAREGVVSSGLFDDLPDVPDEPPAPPSAPPVQTKRDRKPRARKPKPQRLRKDGTLADCSVPKCVRERDPQFFEVYGLFPIKDSKPFAAGHEWDRLMADRVDPALIVEGTRDRDWLREFRHRPRDMWPGLTRWLHEGGWCAERKLDDNDDLAAIFGVTSPSSSGEPPALIALVDDRSVVR